MHSYTGTLWAGLTFTWVFHSYQVLFKMINSLIKISSKSTLQILLNANRYLCTELADRFPAWDTEHILLEFPPLNSRTVCCTQTIHVELSFMLIFLPLVEKVSLTPTLLCIVGKMYLKHFNCLKKHYLKTVWFNCSNMLPWIWQYFTIMWNTTSWLIICQLFWQVIRHDLCSLWSRKDQELHKNTLRLI